MRAHAVIRGIPITTTLDGLRAAINGLEALRAARSAWKCAACRNSTGTARG